MLLTCCTPPSHYFGWFVSRTGEGGSADLYVRTSVSAGETLTEDDDGAGLMAVGPLMSSVLLRQVRALVLAPVQSVQCTYSLRVCDKAKEISS